MRQKNKFQHLARPKSLETKKDVEIIEEEEGEDEEIEQKAENQPVKDPVAPEPEPTFNLPKKLNPSDRKGILR